MMYPSQIEEDKPQATINADKEARTRQWGCRVHIENVFEADT